MVMAGPTPQREVPHNPMVKLTSAFERAGPSFAPAKNEWKGKYPQEYKKKKRKGETKKEKKRTIPNESNCLTYFLK
jgi:hypothetical protein